MYKLIEVKKFMKNFIDRGYEIYLIGGAVRDILNDVEPLDFDFTTNASPIEIKSILENFFELDLFGISYGMIKIKENNYEITSMRIENKYKNRCPQDIKFVNSLKKDVIRRDFTINALALDYENNLYDFLNGKEDLNNGIIRTIGISKKRFIEDPVRILRAFCLMAENNYSFSKELYTYFLNVDFCDIFYEEKIYYKYFKRIIEGKYSFKVLWFWVNKIIKEPSRNDFSSILLIEDFMFKCIYLRYKNNKLKLVIDMYLKANKKYAYYVKILDMIVDSESLILLNRAIYQLFNYNDFLNINDIKEMNLILFLLTNEFLSEKIYQLKINNRIVKRDDIKGLFEILDRENIERKCWKSIIKDIENQMILNPNINNKKDIKKIVFNKYNLYNKLS